MNFLKKLFSSFVALTTIAWSVGVGSLALPSMASAAVAGELIKASGPAVYYYASDAKRYVFPNEKTYFSWYMNFNSVRTITDSELASIMIGGNVTIRPGTNLVKITTDPKVYAVAPNGVLRWIESEALAITLYGASWASRVVDVPDGFFVNYSVGSSISTAQHPDGTVITYAGDSNRYVVWGGMKRKLVDPAFAANNFNPMYVITTSVSYPNGTDVTGRESALADVVAPGATTVGGSVSAALASDTPAGQNVPQGASSIQLAKFNLTAGSAGVLVTGVTLRRVGVGASGDFANVYLYKGDGTRLTTGRTINSSTNVVQFNGLNLSIGAGQTYSLMLVGDTASSLVAGGQHSFEISDAASIVVSGTGSSVSGSFPIRGNVFTIGTTAASRLDVQKGTNPTDPQIGSSEAEIANFKLVAQGNDIEVRRVTLLQTGDVSNTDLTNLKLYQGSTVVASATALAGDKIVLTFSPAYLIPDGTTRVFSLKSSIAGRSGRDIKTYVEYSTDVYAIDTEFGTGARVCIDSSSGCGGSYDGTGTFPTGNFSQVTTEGGQFTTTFNGPATSDIAKGQQDVPLFKFSVTASDSMLEIRKMYFTLSGLTGSDLIKGTAGTEYFRDLKIKNIDTGATVMGPLSLTAANGDTSDTFTFNDSFNVSAGQTLNLAFTADLTNSSDDVAGEFSSDGNNQYRAIMGTGGVLFQSSDIRIVDTGEFLDIAEVVPNSTINGNPMTVKASNLSVSLAASPTAGTAVKKESMIPSAGFVFTAGSQSQILIRSVKLTGTADVTTPGSYTLADLNDAITSCALFDGSTQVGNAQSPDASTGAMNITNVNVTIPAGSSKTLVAKCTADSVVAGAEDKFAVGIATVADVTADDQDSNTVTPSLSASVIANAGTGPSLIQTIKNGGTLTIAADNLRQSTILVAGGDVWQNLAQFKATAQYEAMNLERIAVTSTGDAANFAMIAIAKDGVVAGQDILPAGVTSTKDVDLTSAPIMVPKDGSTTFQLWAKIGPVQSSSTVSGATTGVVRSGNRVALGLNAGLTTGNWSASYAGNFNVRAVGLASGDLVYAASATGVAGNTFVIRKSKPTVTRQTLSTTTLASGSSQDLYRMQISADSAGSVAVKQISFDVSKGDFTLSNFRLRKGSTDMNLADYAIVSDIGTDLEAGTLVAASSSARVVVSFTNEETISGSGNVYTLYATPAGVDASETVSIAPTRNLAGTVTTGYILSGSMAGTGLTNPGLASPSINIDTANDGSADQPGSFVWSDLSEVPHSFATPGSSFDWTNDVYVEDLTQTQTLTR